MNFAILNVARVCSVAGYLESRMWILPGQFTSSVASAVAKMAARARVAFVTLTNLASGSRFAVSPSRRVFISSSCITTCLHHSMSIAINLLFAFCVSVIAPCWFLRSLARYH